jgi:hypothetical protein
MRRFIRGGGGGLVLDDVVVAAQVLLQIDRETALGFIAGLFGFDPNQAPELLPFRAELAVQASVAASGGP